MKFLCVECDSQMISVGKEAPGDGTLAVVFACPTCDRRVAMLANPMETQMVNSLCVSIGGRTTAQQPLESTRARLTSGGEEALRDEPDEGDPLWSAEAEVRLARIPGFVRGMVRRIYSDWARERGVAEITLELMDEARADLGLEGL